MYEDWLSVDDLAKWFKVSKHTVYSWRKKGYGPDGLRVGRHLRYDPKVVEAWIVQERARQEAHRNGVPTNVEHAHFDGIVEDVPQRPSKRVIT